jgi:hypothetical protein
MKPQSTDTSRRLGLKDVHKQVQSRDRKRDLNYLNDSLNADLECIANDDRASLELCLMDLLKQLAYDCYEESWSGSVQGQLNRFLSYAWLNARIWCKSGRKTSFFTYDKSGTETHWATFLLAATGNWPKAAWLAEYLLAHYVKGGTEILMEEDSHDYVFHYLFKLLFTTLKDGRWPDSFPPELGPYRELLTHRFDSEKVSIALGKIMDIRFARNHAYPEIDAPKRFRPLASNLIGGTQFVIFPAELWVIKALCKRLDNLELSLQGEHPWLQASFMTPPPEITEAWHDEVTEVVMEYGNKKFGLGWLDV